MVKALEIWELNNTMIYMSGHRDRIFEKSLNIDFPSEKDKNSNHSPQHLKNPHQ